MMFVCLREAFMQERERDEHKDSLCERKPIESP